MGEGGEVGFVKGNKAGHTLGSILLATFFKLDVASNMYTIH